MKLSDYVAEFLAAQGVRQVFGLTGGAVVHLFDSLARTEGIEPLFCHHEQAAALAASGYARASDSVGVAVFTTGPGGTNALTGVAAAWLDSVPCVFLSGQVRLSHTAQGRGLRQIGTQHLEIVPLVSPLVKSAVMLTSAADIRFELEKAFHIARSGRPGPVWLDIPLDLQWQQIEPASLRPYEPTACEVRSVAQARESGEEACLTAFLQAKRPLIIAGHGIRLAGAGDAFRNFVKCANVPFLTTWNASDLAEGDDQLNIGRPGIFGQRGANLAMQNADFILGIGTHLCVSLTGTMTQAFAREAKLALVDIDAVELKHPHLAIAFPVQADAAGFLLRATQRVAREPRAPITPWLDQTTLYKRRHNAIARSSSTASTTVDPYVFVDTLSDLLGREDDIVVDGGGTVNQVTFQSIRVKLGQRLMISSGLCSMGTGLPESVGACVAHGRRRTICLCGDGSLQLNVQELQTISQHALPVKLFVLNNSGYVSIRATQDGFLEGRHVGSASAGGMSLPDYQKVAAAYGIPSCVIHGEADLSAQISAVLESPGPVLCELVVAPDFAPSPRQGFVRRADGTHSPRPLEDMYPFLDDAEFSAMMLVKPWNNRS